MSRSAAHWDVLEVSNDFSRHVQHNIDQGVGKKILFRDGGRFVGGHH